MLLNHALRASAASYACSNDSGSLLIPTDAMKLLLAAAAASASSFSAMVLQSLLRVHTISASLFRDRIALCASRALANIQVKKAMEQTAMGKVAGQVSTSDGGIRE